MIAQAVKAVLKLLGIIPKPGPDVPKVRRPEPPGK